MLQSLLALPLGAAAEVLLFLALYRLSPLSGRQAAVVVALLSLTAVLLYSLLNWPGADVLAMYVAVLSVTAYLLAIVSHAREQHGPVKSFATRISSVFNLLKPSGRLIFSD